MAILGAHMSIAGGHFKAVERARRCGCDCVQLFTKNNARWQAKPITAKQAQRFRQALQQLRVTHPIAHDSYLINLASPDPVLWRESIRALVIELRRAETLAVPYLVAHPGAYTTGSLQGGLRKIVRALDRIHRRTPGLPVRCLLETTAGQGTSIGWRFEHLAAILDTIKDPDRVGVCFDTCHVFAAGYAMETKRQYVATMKDFDQLIGLWRIKAFHLNDSRSELGSRIDRHEHIGRGQMGLEPFRHLLNDRRFRRIPMYLETPKKRRNGVDWDLINLATLRRLVK